MKRLLIFVMIVFFFQDCANTNKLIESGKYQQAIDKLINKLAGKTNKNRKDILQLEYAFQKAQDSDLNTEKKLRIDDSNEKWEALYRIYEQIEKRQSQLEPLLPLQSKDGYTASFKFINTDELKKESKKQLAEYYYSRATELITAARNNQDKAAARNAYDFLSKIDKLYAQYKDKDQLLKLSKELGTVYHLVRVSNHSNKIIPEMFEEELLRIGVNDLNKTWKSFDAKANQKIQYDYHIILKIADIDASPEREKIRVYDDVNEIETTRKLVDKSGKPLMDSLGKQKTEKIIEKYICTIEEIHQFKAVKLRGQLEWFDLKTKDVDYSRPIEVEAVFENYYGKLVNGDRNKASKDGLKRLNGRPLSFPSNEEMLLDGAVKLKSIMKDMIESR